MLQLSRGKFNPLPWCYKTKLLLMSLQPMNFCLDELEDKICLLTKIQSKHYHERLDILHDWFCYSEINKVENPQLFQISALMPRVSHLTISFILDELDAGAACVFLVL